jgi:hypothetical protein
VAQLGARFHGMEEVVGSIPTRSTKSLNGLAPIAILIPKFLPVISYLCCLFLPVFYCTNRDSNRSSAARLAGSCACV